MREIKFRAWDKADSLMYYDIQNGIKFDDGSKYDFERFLKAPELDDYHRWEIMQYTGLHDKNGKDIYEGDVIKFTHSTGNASDNREVVYNINNCSFCLKTSYGVVDNIGLQKDWCSRYEVIGNIYEQTQKLK